MKKSLKTIITFLLLMGFYVCNVKADSYNLFMADPEFTTVLKGDTINLRVGFDGFWNKFYLDDIEDKEVKNKLNPFYITYNSNVFDIDLSNIKLPKDGYDMSKYYYNYSDNKQKGERTIFFSNVYITDELKRDDDEETSVIDGGIDNTVFDNIKLKVKDNAKEGIYYLTTGYADKDDLLVSETIPISIISKNTEPAGITKLSYHKHDIKLEKDKKDYMISVLDTLVDGLYDEEVAYNAVCNYRCKAYNIGTRAYTLESDNGKDEIYIVYDNKNQDLYTIDHERRHLSFGFNWYDTLKHDDSNYIFSISNAYFLDEVPSYKESVKDHLSDSEEKYLELHYDYKELNEIEKKVIKDLIDNNYNGTSENTTDVYVMEKGKITYHTTVKEEGKASVLADPDISGAYLPAAMIVFMFIAFGSLVYVIFGNRKSKNKVKEDTHEQ